MPKTKAPAPPAVKLASNAMTTLEIMKEMLLITPEASEQTENQAIIDRNITRLINAASAWIETMVGRKFGRNAYTEKHAAYGTQNLVLQQWPILDVEYVKLDGTILPPDQYEWDVPDSGEIGVLYRDNGWAQRSYTGGLANDVTSIKRYIEVKYTAGYVLPKDATDKDPETLPADLQGVVWGIVEQEFSVLRNGAQGLKAFSISDVSWTFDKEPRASWLETINRYARY